MYSLHILIHNINPWIWVLTSRQSLYVVSVQYKLFPSASCLKGTLFKSEFDWFFSVLWGSVGSDDELWWRWVWVSIMLYPSFTATDQFDNCPTGKRFIRQAIWQNGLIELLLCKKWKEVDTNCNANVWFALDGIERNLYVHLIPMSKLGWIAETFGICPLDVWENGGIPILQTAHRYIK